MNLLRSFVALLQTGGPIMIPIAVVSLWMWILIVLKADWVWRMNRTALPVIEALKHLQSGRVPAQQSGCPKAGALRFFLQHHFVKLAQIQEPDRLLFEAAILRHTRDLYRHIPTIMMLAAAAPLLGLLGTVSGMVETFRVIGLYGMGNAQAMAAGIKEALITTQAGLLVAIPGLLAGQSLGRKVQKIHQEMMVFHQAGSQWFGQRDLPCIESA